MNKLLVKIEVFPKILDLLTKRMSPVPENTVKVLSCCVSGNSCNTGIFTWRLSYTTSENKTFSIEEVFCLNIDVFYSLMEGISGDYLIGDGTCQFKIEEYLQDLADIDREDNVSFSEFITAEFEMTKLFMRFVFEESEQ